VVHAPRGAHSVKPAIFYEIIERLYPEYEKRELFLRGQPRPGWLGWGNQAEAPAVRAEPTSEPPADGFELGELLDRAGDAADGTRS
jgi:N6-adenosine-specific RNA methylase IME4